MPAAPFICLAVVLLDVLLFTGVFGCGSKLTQVLLVFAAVAVELGGIFLGK